MIEVTQMNDNATRIAPALDVLADTLHDIRQKSAE